MTEAQLTLLVRPTGPLAVRPAEAPGRFSSLVGLTKNSCPGASSTLKTAAYIGKRYAEIRKALLDRMLDACRGTGRRTFVKKIGSALRARGGAGSGEPAAGRKMDAARATLHTPRRGLTPRRVWISLEIRPAQLRQLGMRGVYFHITTTHRSESRCAVSLR